MKLKGCYVLLIILVLYLLLALFGITLFSNSTIGILLLLTHILSALTIGIILGIISRFKKFTKNKKENIYIFEKNKKSINLSHSKNTVNFKNLGVILSEAILESSKTIIMIGGFVILFSIIISILNTSKILEIFSYTIYPILNFFKINTFFASPVISGMFELTNGISIIAGIYNKSISINIILCAFLLGFGGISVLLQVLSIISKSDISIKKYVLGKFMQGIIAASYTYILINTIPIFNFNL